MPSRNVDEMFVRPATLREVMDDDVDMDGSWKVIATNYLVPQSPWSTGSG